MAPVLQHHHELDGVMSPNYIRLLRAFNDASRYVEFARGIRSPYIQAKPHGINPR